MAFSKKYSSILFFILALPLCFEIALIDALATNPCNTGLAEPPFLAFGVDPNLLLLIDNSGSTLDLGYVDTDSHCFDDTYNSALTYAGYFDQTSWYAYDFSAEKFVKWDDLSADEQNTVFNTVSFDEYYYNASPLYAYIKLDAANSSVTGFKAYGNFLNWASASKIDIQKEILTGGKYDDSNHLLIMESRGCSGRRFIKQIALDTTDHSGTVTAETNTLTLAIKPPEQPTYAAWAAGTTYNNVLEDIVSDSGYLYIAGSALTSGSTSLSSDISDDKDWHRYSPWASGTPYPAGSIVTDLSKANTLDKGTAYYTANGGTSSESETGIDGDSGVTDWEPYHRTYIEVFPVTTNGFNYAECQEAIDELADPSGVLGQIKAKIDDCMGYQQGPPSDEADAQAAFNHAMHFCWYYSKHQEWPPGEGSIASTKNSCENIYEYDVDSNVYGGIEPWNIDTDDRGYLCFGNYITATKVGYVGRCWEPPSTGGEPDYQPESCESPTVGTDPRCGSDLFMETCNGSYNAHHGTCGGNPGEWVQMLVDINAGSLTDDWGWTDDDGDGGDACVDQAMIDYCGVMQIPEVIDPSDQAGATGEVWNIPAVLVDSGVLAQLNEPLGVLKGQIEQTSAPEGLIQEYDNDIRMGAMAFNDDGSLSECDDSDTHILYQCTATDNRDGGKIISDIDKSADHTIALINAINDIKATSWTPLAEAMYNAIGYYQNNNSRELDPDDFDESYNPVDYICQDNNILIITEGASTMDQASAVVSFVGTGGQNDTDSEDSVDCGDLSGSPYLDDMTYYAYNENPLHTTLDNQYAKKYIRTHIVVAGTLRVTGTNECSPNVLLSEAADNSNTDLYEASDPGELEAELRDAFESIRAGAAAGSAASVISASRGGEGASYQAIFWPWIELPGSDETVDWTGEVHSLFVDSLGNLYEDTNHDRTLDTSPGGDEKVSFYFNESIGSSKACNGTVTPTCDGTLTCNGTVTTSYICEGTLACTVAFNPSNNTCAGDFKDLEDVNYLWSAAEWLAKIGPTTSSDGSTDILSNRTTYISNEYKRYIFTWNDLNTDGIVTSSELLDFVDSGTTGGTDWSVTPTNRDTPLPYDFGVTTVAEVDEIVKWVRGLDQTGLRSREMPYDFNPSDMNPETNVYWRLGDVVHSTPISVSGPAEGLHFLYGDDSYRQFVGEYKTRRHMIYFGGNDGMIHALNGGFYDEINTRFCRTNDIVSCPDSGPELGAEMWAYVPYNLLPHLKCLKDPDYEHKYFVDLHPRIFDVRIFNDDNLHPGGWGTILVQGMRFGGAKVRPGELDLDATAGADYPTDTREFTSAYVILDITNPEAPPTLLGEFTRKTDASQDPDHVNLAYTTVTPTLVVMTDDADNNSTSWYLILGSGPTTVDGTSDQYAKLAVLPLSQLVSTNKFRIEDTAPTAGDESGTFTLSSRSFVTDMISVDFELDEDYKTDVVYFGTVSGTWGSWGGGMYRLVTRQVDTTGDQNVTLPSEWNELLSSDTNQSLQHPNPSGETQTNPNYLIDVGQPVTGAASIGFDGENYWVYFGTGRFFDEDDKTDAGSNAQQTFYGIKEPRNCWSYTGTSKCNDCLNGGKGFTWETIEKTTDSWNSTPGAQGLLQVDKIEVGFGNTATDSNLTCPSGDGCLALQNNSITTFAGLDHYIAGTGTCFDSDDDENSNYHKRSTYETGTDGWYKDFHEARERNLGQATLLGGLLTFTTYQPFEDACLPEGLGFLYGVYFRTGTAWYQSVFGSDVDENEPVPDRIDLGRGLAITPNLHVGKQEGSKAFVQTSTGTIVEIPQPNLPLGGVGTGRISWGEIK
jgi:type IV pilus assembly protein PilY1